MDGTVFLAMIVSLAAGLLGSPWSDITCFIWFSLCLVGLFIAREDSHD
jgi:hypothetical protein